MSGAADVREDRTTDLLSRFEAAGEGSREIDAEICHAAGFIVQADPKDWLGLSEHGDPVSIPHYTTSLDAALPWENITLVAYSKIDRLWSAIHEDENGVETFGIGKTEVLARRIAALRARAG